jgi:hypothetical protein
VRNQSIFRGRGRARSLSAASPRLLTNECIGRRTIMTIIVGRWCRRSAMGYAVLQEDRRCKTCRPI